MGSTESIVFRDVGMLQCRETWYLPEWVGMVPPEAGLYVRMEDML